MYKTGGRVERVPLAAAERLRRCLLRYKLVAWRVLYVMGLGREVPNVPCDVVFPAAEWKPVWRVATQAPLPEDPPALGQFVQLLGSVGGHNGRKGDGPPGLEARWRGLRRMRDLSRAWQTFGPQTHFPTPPRRKTALAIKRKNNTCV